MSMLDFIGYLSNLGYEELDSGSYATVYAIPGSAYVCKVGYVDGSLKEDAYLRFLSKMPTTNPLFPKIEAVGIFHFSGDVPDGYKGEYADYYIVHMERLATYDSIPDTKIAAGLGSHGLESIYQLEDWSLKHKPIKKPSQYMEKAIRVLARLYKLFEEDIHQGNVMWRHSNAKVPQLVITDPIA